MKFRHLLAGTALCMALFAFQSPVFAAPAEQKEESIAEGVYAGEVNIGGLSKEKAKEAVDSYYQEIASSPFTVTMDTQSIQTTLAELGLSWDSQNALDEADRLGKSGPILQRYKTLMDMKYGHVVLEVPYQIDEAKVREFVKSQVASHDTEPKNATITRKSGSFIVTEHTTGLSTDQETTVNNILTAVKENLASNMQVAAQVEVTQPSRTYDELSLIQDRLGTFSTDYSDSVSGRKTNISVATERLNGKVLMPGESLSVSETILPREPENGYEKATQYKDGDTEEAYGGGVCQVSTTLYNAILRAELKVTSRSPHSMVVSYVPYSTDAAIAAGSKDMVFENNLDHPVYLAASADGSTLTFSLYGAEYRPSNRKVEFESTTVSKKDPEPKTVYDANMYEGEQKSTGTNKPEVTAYLEKVVYEDGKEVSRTKLHTDHYSGASKTTVVGTKPKESVPAAVPSESPTDNANTPSETPSDNTNGNSGNNGNGNGNGNGSNEGAVDSGGEAEE